MKLFVEEEDVTVTLLLDASASMATGHPDKLAFAKRGELAEQRVVLGPSAANEGTFIVVPGDSQTTLPVSRS